jgi:hypothetical protein
VGGDEGRYLPGEIPVIVLDRARVDGRASGHLMGATPRHPSVRAAWIFSSGVVWALGLGRDPLSTSEEREVARALGRVVAHEIVHVVAPEVPHARKGLMQPSLNRYDLIRPGLTLESQHHRAFVAGLGSFLAEETPDGPGAPSSALPDRLADGAGKRP